MGGIDSIDRVSTHRATRMTRDARRHQVLAVALDLFARDGFHHVSMDDIAERAEVSKPVLYRHFPSKLDLYLAVVDHRGEALVAAVDEALAGVGARPLAAGQAVVEAVAEALVRAYVRFVADSGDSFALLFESDVTHDDVVRERVEHASREVAGALRRGLVETTALSEDEADLVATVLLSMATATATWTYRSDAVPVEVAIELISTLVWGGVSGLARARPSAGEPGAP